MLESRPLSELLREYPRSSHVLGERASEQDRPPPDPQASVKQRTANSFAYEWSHFGQARSEWDRNFRDYLQPHSPESLRGRTIIDVGAGSGRHSRQASFHGARVVAVDIGRSIDVARINLPPDVLTVQADAERLPFERGTFDLAMSIGVLHHLPDPMRGLRELVRLTKPGGHVHVYLYWVPDLWAHRALLKLVSAARVVTVRLPHRLLHALCYPLSAFLYVSTVIPYRALRGRPKGRTPASFFPLKTYADYPFGVLVNDQFDRFSAPLERRFTRRQVTTILTQSDLDDVAVIPNHGWVGDGRVPSDLVRVDEGAGGPPRMSVIVTVRNDMDGLEELFPALAARRRPLTRSSSSTAARSTGRWRSLRGSGTPTSRSASSASQGQTSQPAGMPPCASLGTTGSPVRTLGAGPSLVGSPPCLTAPRRRTSWPEYSCRKAIRRYSGFSESPIIR